MGVVFMAEQTEPVRRKVAAEGHQAGHGHPAGHRPLRGRAAGAGADGPPQHRQGPRRRRRPKRAGPTSSWSWSRASRSPSTATSDQPDRPRAAGAVRPGLPGGAARPPEGDHPPRPQAVQRPGRRSTTASRCPRSSTSAWPRRPGQTLTERTLFTGFGADRRHAGVHEPRAGGARPASTSTPAATSTRWACCSTSC